MKKQIFFLAVAAMAMASCSQDETIDMNKGKGIVTGTVENHVVPLDFTLKHCMALAVVEAPCIRYHITTYNSKQTACDIVIYSHTDIGFTGEAQPYFYSSDHCYRYIVRPEQDFTLTGSYTDTTNEYVYDFTVEKGEIDLTAGLYTCYKVDKGLETRVGDYHELGLVRIGDLFCPTEDLSDWYLVPHEVDKLAENDKPSGIVFQTDWRRFGTAEKDFLGGRENMHGLVVSVKYAVNSLWSTADFIEDTELLNCTTLEDCYNNISGLYNCEYIKKQYGSFNGFPAFKTADEHGQICPIPNGKKTTGWYFPAAGQVWDMFQNLGDIQKMAETEWQTSQEDIFYDPKITTDKNILSALNKWMEKIPPGDKDKFEGKYYRASSEYDKGYTVSYVFTSKYISFGTVPKNTNEHNVRPVLAF